MESVFNGIFDGELVATISVAGFLLCLGVFLSAVVIVLGDDAPGMKTEASTALSLDSNGVAWN